MCREVASAVSARSSSRLGSHIKTASAGRQLQPADPAAVSSCTGHADGPALVREDFFLARSFRIRGERQQHSHQILYDRMKTVVIGEASRRKSSTLPLASFRTVLKLERRVSHEGMVSVGGNLYSVPDATRKRIVEVHTLANEVQIFGDGT